mgnify:CR=1 FL=1
MLLAPKRMGDDDKELVRADLVVSGSSLIVGTAHIKRLMLIQKGSQMFQLIVVEAMVGPMNETT